MADLITGMFRDRLSAERAVTDLQNLGYAQQDISIMMNDQTRARDFADHTGTKATEGAGVGAGIGGTIGAIVAALTATGSVAAALVKTRCGRMQGSESDGRGGSWGKVKESRPRRVDHDSADLWIPHASEGEVADEAAPAIRVVPVGAEASALELVAERVGRQDVHSLRERRIRDDLVAAGMVALVKRSGDDLRETRCPERGPWGLRHAVGGVRGHLRVNTHFMSFDFQADPRDLDPCHVLEPVPAQ